MQQKRNIRLLISLCVLTVVTALLIFLSNRTDNVVDKTVFRIADLRSVDRIVLEHDSSKVELKLDASGRWKANDQLADRSMIDVLFATLQQAEPKRRVSDKLADSLTTYLKKNGTAVTLYQGNESPLRFYAGGSPSKSQAYFTKEGDEDVYIMVIPGYRVYTSGIFELEASGWKDKYVFGFNWQNFKKLSVSFAASPADNFDVTMDRLPVIEGVQADTAKLNSFLDNVSLLTVDQYLTKSQAVAYDSARFVPPVEISVSDLSGKVYSLRLYAEPGEQVAFGMVQGEYPAVFNSRKVLPLMKSKGWFVKK